MQHLKCHLVIPKHILLGSIILNSCTWWKRFPFRRMTYIWILVSHLLGIEFPIEPHQSHTVQSNIYLNEQTTKGFCQNHIVLSTDTYACIMIFQMREIFHVEDEFGNLVDKEWLLDFNFSILPHI